MATVLVIGGQGVLGSNICEVLRERSDYRVLIGTRRNPERDDFRHVDLADPSTIRGALQGVDFAISTVADSQFELERVAIETGARSINVSSAVLPPGGHGSIKGNGLALVHAGLAPLGLQALVAKDLLARNPGAARLELAICFSARGASGLQGKEFAHTALTRLPFEPARVVSFGAPIGLRRCVSAAIAERDILGSLAPGVEAGVYVGYYERWVNGAIGALRASRLIRALPRSLFVNGGRDAPRRTREPVRQRVSVYDAGGKLLAARMTEAEGDYHATALCTLAFLDALVERLKTRKPFGVHGAERIFSLDDLVPHLPSEIAIRDVA